MGRVTVIDLLNDVAKCEYNAKARQQGCKGASIFDNLPLHHVACCLHGGNSVKAANYLPQKGKLDYVS